MGTPARDRCPNRQSRWGLPQWFTPTRPAHAHRPAGRGVNDLVSAEEATVRASRLILGAPKRNALMNLIRGSVIREVSDLLPEEIDLLVYA